MIQELNVWTINQETSMSEKNREQQPEANRKPTSETTSLTLDILILKDLLIMSRNLTSNPAYPLWTYGPYSSLTITLQDPDEDINGPSRDRKGSLIAATIPAQRGSLNCTGLSEDSIRILFDDRGVNVNISADSAPGCPITPGNFWCSDYPSSGFARPLMVG